MNELIYDELELSRLNRLPERARNAIVKITNMADNIFWSMGNHGKIEYESMYELANSIYDKEVLYRKF